MVQTVTRIIEAPALFQETAISNFLASINDKNQDSVTAPLGSLRNDYKKCKTNKSGPTPYSVIPYIVHGFALQGLYTACVSLNR